MTVFALRTRDDLLALRFACSPIWETQAAVQAFADERACSYHGPWKRLVGERAARLDLTPLLAVLPVGGFVPDFLTPPPRTARPRLRDQLADIGKTPPTQVGRELERCRDTRDLLANRLFEAWRTLIAPFWSRISTLLERDIEERSRTLVGHGLRRVLEELHPRIRWTKRGLSCAGGSGRIVEVDERGLVLMPSAYLWPKVAAIVDEPWLPTIAYPARGIAELWNAPTAPPDALARLLGRTRALVLANLDQPLSTSTLAALIDLSAAGTSRHLLALRDTGLVSTTRHGHEVRYSRTALGSALMFPRRS